MKTLRLLAGIVAAQDFVLEPEYETVTCGSMVKLANKATTHRLHSHDVKYGSGSGQQSVTAYPRGNDPNSYFRVEKEGCDRGVAVPPLSNQQEVSAYTGSDSGDNWRVGCKTKYWKREAPVTLEHVDTKKFLTSSTRYAYGNPIQGQHEVAAKSYSGDNELWIAQEGIYFATGE
ncbi:Stromal cell-derived factor 2-like protein 1 [Kappamyces sp. JEL0680]|nr:Stromal cell-derived factor 2-like protein 1 [Kappamyces sp. JEL0680]